MFEVRKLVLIVVNFHGGSFSRVNRDFAFQRCIGGLLTQNTHGERSIRRLVNSAVFLRFRAGSRRAIGIPHTKSGGGGFRCLGVVRHGPGLATHMFLNRISRVLAGGGYCRLGCMCVKVLADMSWNNGTIINAARAHRHL